MYGYSYYTCLKNIHAYMKNTRRILLVVTNIRPIRRPSTVLWPSKWPNRLAGWDFNPWSMVEGLRVTTLHTYQIAVKNPSHTYQVPIKCLSNTSDLGDTYVIPMKYLQCGAPLVIS